MEVCASDGQGADPVHGEQHFLPNTSVSLLNSLLRDGSGHFSKDIDGSLTEVSWLQQTGIIWKLYRTYWLPDEMAILNGKYGLRFGRSYLLVGRLGQLSFAIHKSVVCFRLFIK